MLTAESTAMAVIIPYGLANEDAQVGQNDEEHNDDQDRQENVGYQRDNEHAVIEHDQSCESQDNHQDRKGDIRQKQN